MVSNFERILEEIRKEADRLAPGYDSELVVDLVMQIVNLEDEHRVRAQRGMERQVRNMIEKSALTGQTKGG